MGRVMGFLGWVRLTRKKIESGHESTRFCFGSKKSSSVKYFSGQKILTRSAMSSRETEGEYFVSDSSMFRINSDLGFFFVFLIRID